MIESCVASATCVPSMSRSDELTRHSVPLYTNSMIYSFTHSCNLVDSVRRKEETSGDHESKALLIIRPLLRNQTPLSVLTISSSVIFEKRRKTLELQKNHSKLCGYCAILTSPANEHFVKSESLFVSTYILVYLKLASGILLFHLTGEVLDFEISIIISILPSSFDGYFHERGCLGWGKH